ncbi:MAG: hypothetical protein OEQ25_02755 [Gammaproteobacteria bacterium]|nr:hypothetical protein [Gammaproteobacteria bacterium]MDH3506036.1 hypothetical protein [Gammaproteobacteria bacterium]
MRYLSLFTIVIAGLIAAAPVSAQSTAEIIAAAVRPLPEDLRDGATVYRYAADTGERIMLRQGTNHIECRPEDANGFTRCESVLMGPRRDLEAKLRAQGVEGDALQAAVAEAEAAGDIDPVPFGTMLYRLFDTGDRIQRLWLVRLPNATADQLAMPTASQRDNSLAGMGLPWMMREGTPNAHLMIPINGTELSNPGGTTTRANTKHIDDPIEQALLPLPDSLKDGATVVRYDRETGERNVLRQGTNVIECQTRDPVTLFIRCYHEQRGPEYDLRAKLTAQGMSNDEIGAQVDAARAAGTIPPRPFALDYRVYEDDDRIKYLWILRMPDTMSEDLGMSTASQRDSSLAGQGLPWMMREGTPNAHLMIPINSTELSN